MAKLAEFDRGQAIFRCTHQKCQELFIANYCFRNRHDGGRPAYELQSLAPINFQASTFPDTVAGMSPNFVEICNQAVAAEAANLDQIVGIGLRKALEFLIKDYAASEHPSKVDEIRTTQLGPCINNFVTDSNVKECAKRAAWLGNDETHYVRKWETKDVNDLKLLVRLTVNWIDSVLLTRKYIGDMGTGKT